MLVEVTRSGHRESHHRVHVAVVDTTGAVVAAAGDVDLITCIRSAAKPLQASVAVRTGAADAFGFDEEALALACGSHSGEAVHTAVAARMLSACGCGEQHLACGTHPSLSSKVRRTQLLAGQVLTPITNNCSGKHAAMLATARHLAGTARRTDDDAVHGYERPDHPVQRAIRETMRSAMGLDDADLQVGVDGCRAVTFFAPLRAMARAWATVANDQTPAFARLRQAMWRHPVLVAGEGRACTDFLRAGADGEKLLVKIGAEGVYCAGLPSAGLGIALKVESGDAKAAPVALAAVLEALDELRGGALALPHTAWAQHRRLVVRDTRGEPVGHILGVGGLRG